MIPYNVITFEINRRKFERYDVMPYFIRAYENARKKPKTDEEIKNFVIKEARYMFWARCEWEIIISDWPSQQTSSKIDVYYQIESNIDLVARAFKENIKELKKSKKVKNEQSVG